MRAKLERLGYDTMVLSLAVICLFFLKVGRDKKKDSLELWLNTFFSLEAFRFLPLLCLFFFGTK